MYQNLFLPTLLNNQNHMKKYKNFLSLKNLRSNLVFPILLLPETVVICENFRDFSSILFKTVNSFSL